jgi:hypothetical protein
MPPVSPNRRRTAAVRFSVSPHGDPLTRIAVAIKPLIDAPWPYRGAGPARSMGASLAPVYLSAGLPSSRQPGPLSCDSLLAMFCSRLP